MIAVVVRYRRRAALNQAFGDGLICADVAVTGFVSWPGEDLALDNARGRLDFRELDNPEALVKLDAFDKRIAFDSLRRPFDPDAPLFIDYAEHVSAYQDTDRAPVPHEH